MAEYIERERLLRDVRIIGNQPWSEWETAGVIDVINKQPAADVAPVKHGKWNGWHGDKLVGIDDNGDDMYRHYHYNTCSECGRGNAIKSSYCPNCGAKMDLED